MNDDPNSVRVVRLDTDVALSESPYRLAMECGCIGSVTGRVKYCPLHAQAPAMLALLRALAEGLECGSIHIKTTGWLVENDLRALLREI